jgi:hypothetical protein
MVRGRIALLPGSQLRWQVLLRNSSSKTRFFIGAGPGVVLARTVELLQDGMGHSSELLDATKARRAFNDKKHSHLFEIR